MMTDKNFGLSQEDVEKIRAVLSQYPQVEKAILYGSRAMGNHKKNSDIDLTLVGGTDLTLQILYKIMNDIDDLLLPYTIDLSILENIDDADVRNHIQRVGKVFYRRKSDVLQEESLK